MNGTRIEVVDRIKTLGIIFSEHMLWDFQIENVMTKLARTVGIFYRTRDLLPTKTKLLLYNALFLSYLRYCFLVWGTTTSSNITKLARLQNKTVRIIPNSPFDTSAGPLLKKLNLISAENFYYYRLSTALRNEAKRSKIFLTSFAQLIPNVPVYNTRHTEHWTVRCCRTNYGNQMLSYTVPNLLNQFIERGVDFHSLRISELLRMYL